MCPDNFIRQNLDEEYTDGMPEYIRMVGNNYNQTLIELKSHFSERRTAALVYKLEKYMMQLVQTIHKVIELTGEYQKKVQKSRGNNIRM